MLAYLSMLEDDECTALVAQQFSSADNMTDSQAALALLVDLPGSERDAALQVFYDRWRDDPLVLDKWFSVQALSTQPDTLERVLDSLPAPRFQSAQSPTDCAPSPGSSALPTTSAFTMAEARPIATWEVWSSISIP